MNKVTPISKGNAAILDTKDIKNGIVRIIKNWYWFVLFIGLGVGASIFYLYKTIPIYGARAEILMKPQKNAFKDALSASLPTETNREEISNEMQILKSTKLIDEVVGKLNLEVSYFIEGRIKTGEVYKGTPFAVSDAKLLDGSLYGAKFFVKIINSDSYTLSVQTPTFNFTKAYKFGEPVVNEKFSFNVSNNEKVIKENPKIGEINYYFIINNHDYLVRKYQGAISVEKDQDASVIIVSLDDEVQERAVDVLQTIVNTYIDNSISVLKDINENSIKFIDGQLSEVENQLNGVEASMVNYQVQKGVAGTEDQSSAVIGAKMNVEEERTKLTGQLNAVRAMYESLASSNEAGIAPTLVSEDPSIATAFSQLSALQQKRESLLFSNTPNSPIVKEVEADISRSKKSLIETLLNIQRTLVTKINVLSTQVGQYQGAISQMPSTMRGLTNIQRKVEINEKIYLFLLETRAQTVIAKASIVADKFILEPAGSNGLIAPIRNKILFMGFGAGIALAFALIFLKGIFYNYINTKDELAEITTLPIIGVVGKTADAKKDYLVVANSPQSLTTEAFRVIRTNLSYFSSKSQSKVVLFTSSISGEGKTFCAVNTATILARAKKKVVLIDLDLHKPRQATAFNMTNDIGVTSYLVGKATLDQVLKDTPVENLSLILSGPKTPNASELILDPMLEQMINELKTRFEYIILDMPPVGLISDALVLMKQSDLNLYVVKAGYSKKEFVEVAHQLIEKNNIKSLSFILNGVNAKNIPAGYGGGYYK